MRDEDFPLEISETAYSGFVEDGGRFIRIIDSEGVIVSPADKSEIDTQFELLEGAMIMEPGMIDADGMVTNYKPLEKYGLVIVS